jgi:hypothetical protein
MLSIFFFNKHVDLFHIGLVHDTDWFCNLCLGGLGFEFRASFLQSKHSTSQVTPPVHFALVILEVGVSGTICQVFVQLQPSQSQPPEYLGLQA